MNETKKVGKITSEDVLRLLQSDTICKMLRIRHQKRCTACSPILDPTKSEIKSETKSEPEPETDSKHKSESSNPEPETDDKESEDEFSPFANKFKKTLCVLDQEILAAWIAEKYNEQKGACVSCHLPLELYKNLHSASNFRFRITDPYNCPATANMSGLICIPCENLLIAVNHVQEDFTRTRNLLFSDAPVSHVKYTAYLEKTTGLPSCRGVAKPVLRNTWNAQGGMSAYRIPVELRSLFPKSHQEQMAKYVETSEDISVATLSKEEKKAKDEVTWKERWTNPNYVTFLIPLQVQSLFFQPKLYPECLGPEKGDSFSWTKHTFVANILLRMQGSLNLRHFLVWALRALKQLVPDDKITIKRRFFRKFVKPSKVSEGQTQTSQNQVSEKDLIETLRLHAVERKAATQWSEKASEVRHSPAYIKTLKNAEQAMYLLQKAGKSSVPLPDYSTNVSLKLPVKGRARKITEDAVSLHLPSLLKENFPVLSKNEIDEGALRLTKQLFSEELLGRDPPEWSMSWSRDRKRKKTNSENE